MDSVGIAKYMVKFILRMDVFKDRSNRLSGVPEDKQAEEGKTVAVEAIERVKQVKGVVEFHIIATKWEGKVPEIVERSGLYPRPIAE